MKKVLLLTDFSDVSDNATRYALEMFGGKVYAGKVEFTLFHVLDITAPLSNPVDVPWKDKSQSYQKVENRLIKSAARWRMDYPGQVIKKQLGTGEVVQETVKLVDSASFDLVVVGSYQKSGLDRWIEGLNAHEIAKRVGCAVLVIPNTVTYKKLDKIVFATDFKNLSDLNILNPLRDLVSALEPDFIMLHIHSKQQTTTEELSLMNRVLNLYFSTGNYQHRFLEHADPAEGIESFVLENDAGMLALVGQERNFFERLFHKSVTRKMILHAELPLIILNDKKREPLLQDDVGKSGYLENSSSGK